MSTDWKKLDSSTLRDQEFEALTNHLRSGRVDAASSAIIAKAVDAQTLSEKIEMQQARINELEARLGEAAASKPAGAAEQ